MSDEKIINDLLYKLLIFQPKEEVDPKLVVLIGTDVNTNRSINTDGEKTTNKTILVHMLSITDTLEEGVAVFDSWMVTNAEEFVNSFSDVSIEVEEHNVDILTANALLMHEFNEIGNKAQNIAKAISIFKLLSTNQGSLDMGEDLNGLVYETLEGLPEDLPKENINQLGSIVLNLVLQNSHLDLSNYDQLNDLHNDIKSRMEKAIPELVDQKMVRINCEPITSEIKRFQGKLF